MKNPINKFTAQIKQEQIRSLFKQSIFLFLGILVVMFVVLYFFWDRADRKVLLSWFYLNLTLTLARAVLVKIYERKQPQGDALFIWGNVFVISAFLSGVIWGSISFLFLNPDEIEGMALIAVILTGMTAGSLVPLSSYIPAYFGFACAALLQFVFVMVTQSADVFNLVGYMVFAFLLVNGGYSFVVNRNMADSFRLRFENLDLMEDLEIKKEEAEKANKDKSRFLTATSHDLRQPLHAMDLYLGALKNILNTDEQSELLDKSQASSKALSELLNAIMDVSRLDAGTTTIEKENINLKLLLEEVYHSMQPLAEEQNITIHIEISDITVFSDPILLGRLIRNLVSNAIKHSEGKNIKLVGSTSQDGVVVKVIDDGKGIVITEIENIFSEFYQLNNPERDRTKGLGLGLAIVKRIANQLEHKLEVSSELNQGSTFSILLPVVNNIKVLKQEQVNSEVVDLSGLFVIIIEDETNVRDAMRLLLRSWDCEVLAGDSLAAINSELEQADYPLPDVIISDYRLRENETGLDAIIKLRKKFDATIPALIVTGDTENKIAENIINEQCELVHKPINADKLQQNIAAITTD